MVSPVWGESHSDEEATNRTTHRFSGYDTLMTKLSEWVKSADGVRIERLEEGTFHLQSSKEDLEKSLSLLKRIKWYREKIADNCESADASAKQLGESIDACIASGFFSDAAGDAKQVNGRFEMQYSLAAIQECKKTLSEYFQEKRKIVGTEKTKFSTDWEMEAKFGEFFDLFGTKNDAFKSTKKENKLVDALKKMTPANLCQVEVAAAKPVVPSQPSSEDKGQKPNEDLSRSSTPPKAAKSEPENKKPDAPKSDSALQSNQRAATQTATGKGAYQSPQAGYQAPQGGYKIPDGGYQAPQGGYKYNANDYQFDQGKYAYNPNLYKYDNLGAYDGGGQYNAIPYFPKKNYDNNNPHYTPSQPQYFPPPPPSVRNTPPPIIQPPPVQPPPPPAYPIMPFLPPPPPPPQVIVSGGFEGGGCSSCTPPVVVAVRTPTPPNLGVCTQQLLGMPCQSNLPGLGIPGIPPMGTPFPPMGNFPPTGISPMPYPIPGFPTTGFPTPQFPQGPYPQMPTFPTQYPMPPVSYPIPTPTVFSPGTQNINTPPIRYQVPRGAVLKKGR